MLGMTVWYDGMVWYVLSGHTCILGMLSVVMPFKAYHKHTEDVNRLNFNIL